MRESRGRAAMTRETYERTVGSWKSMTDDGQTLGRRARALQLRRPRQLRPSPGFFAFPLLLVDSMHTSYELVVLLLERVLLERVSTTEVVREY